MQKLLHSPVGWRVGLQKICPPGTLGYDFTRNRVLADEIKLRILRWDYQD